MFKAKNKTKEPENAEKAYEYAVFLLSLQLRTAGEVREKMLGRGYSQKAVEETVARLLGQKYLDDQSYAEVFLENLKSYKSFGFYGIKRKFLEKKLPPEIIEAVLSQGLPLAEEIKIAERFLKKEGFAAKAKLSDDELQYRSFDQDASKQKQKIAQRLRARGFRSEVIAKLVF